MAANIHYLDAAAGNHHPAMEGILVEVAKWLCYQASPPRPQQSGAVELERERERERERESTISALNKWYTPLSKTGLEPHRVMFATGSTAGASSASLAKGIKFKAAQSGPLVHCSHTHFPATHVPLRLQSTSVEHPYAAASVTAAAAAAETAWVAVSRVNASISISI